MEIWYVEEELSPSLPEGFYDWLNISATTVFLHEKKSLTTWKDNIKIINYTSETPDGIELNADFGYSLNLANTVMKECEVRQRINKYEDKICILINNGNNAVAHFLLQNSICKHDQLKNFVIVLIQNDQFSEIESEIVYKFPDYWIKKKNTASIYSAHGILTWDKSVYNLLNEFQEVLLLTNINDYSNVTDWISTKLTLQKTSYPAINGLQEKPTLESDKYGELLSVIVPFYNMGAFLLETIESIKKSTYPNFEIIIVNDGSDDDESLRVLESIGSSFSSISIINIENKGLANARNVGAHYANGKFITFLDADDLIDPFYYERCIRILDSYNNVSFVYSWVQFFGLKDNIWITFDAEFPLILLTNMLSAFPVIRKKSFIDFGLNNLIMDKGMEDHESWISMLENGCKGVSIPEPLVFYRIRSDSMSRQFNRQIVNELFYKISKLHPLLYQEHSHEIFNLVYANGPGYLWNNPAIKYPDVSYNLEEVNNVENKVKYELIRLFNSKKGRFIVKWFFKLKMNRLFK